MKLDDIIKQLEAIGPWEREPQFNVLSNLVLELAHHVKAQEPDPLSEEDMMMIEEYDKLNARSEEIDAALDQAEGIRHGLKE